MPYKGNFATGDGFDQRLTLGFKFLDKFVETDNGTDAIDVDVVGFSRGATEARVWINQLVAKLKDKKYTSGGKSRCINLRFEGLWDTVPHLGALNGKEKNYDFSIPSMVRHAVHAVALNEHRGGATNFHVRSIWDQPGGASSSNRIEKGFIGSHADIGGAYGAGDLSNVALMWMINQAQTQGVVFEADTISRNGWDTVTNPIVHDKSEYTAELGDLIFSRDVIYGNGANPTSIDQQKVAFDGKTVEETKTLIKYFKNPYACEKYHVGLVYMEAYLKWIASYGVSIKIGPLNNASCS